jgi:hypothetical protein
MIFRKIEIRIIFILWRQFYQCGTVFHSADSDVDWRIELRFDILTRETPQLATMAPILLDKISPRVLTLNKT